MDALTAVLNYSQNHWEIYYLGPEKQVYHKDGKALALIHRYRQNECAV